MKYQLTVLSILHYHLSRHANTYLSFFDRFTLYKQNTVRTGSLGYYTCVYHDILLFAGDPYLYVHLIREAIKKRGEGLKLYNPLNP